MSTKNYTIYRHTSPSGKVYIGMTRQSLTKRWNNGNGYATNLYFFRAIKKYGWNNFKHDTLLEGLTQDEAELAEKLFIGYYKANNPIYGYNIENSGNSIHKHSEATKEKIRQANTGKRHTEESKAKMSASRKGKPFSQEHKEAMSKARQGKPSPMKGKKHSDKTRRKMSEMRRGENNEFYGRHHTKETKERISFLNCGVNSKFSRKVAQIDQRGGEIINLFDSTREAERAIGIAHGSISRCCNNKQRTASGYKWKYLEDINL